MFAALLLSPELAREGLHAGSTGAGGSVENKEEEQKRGTHSSGDTCPSKLFDVNMHGFASRGLLFDANKEEEQKRCPQLGRHVPSTT